MLFTDNDVASTALLLQIDTEVERVAATTKPVIVIEGALSICTQAWSECGRQITAAQQTYTGTLSNFGVSGAHQAAVSNIGGPATNMARTRLNQIVASESQYGNAQSSVQLWVAYSALALFYRDASARMGQDRLEEKYRRYEKDANFAWMKLRQNGLPWLANPLECPGAKHGVNPGTWAAANLSNVVGSGTLRTLQVAITYYDGSKYVSAANKGNGESGPSEILTFAQTLSHVLQIDITGLNPPAGVMDQVGLSQGSWAPLNATHWQVFVGAATGPLFFQAAVPIATKVYTMAGDPVLSGVMLGGGQSPIENLTFTNMVGRG